MRQRVLGCPGTSAPRRLRLPPDSLLKQAVYRKSSDGCIRLSDGAAVFALGCAAIWPGASAATLPGRSGEHLGPKIPMYAKSLVLSLPLRRRPSFWGHATGLCARRPSRGPGMRMVSRARPLPKGSARWRPTAGPSRLAQAPPALWPCAKRSSSKWASLGGPGSWPPSCVLTWGALGPPRRKCHGGAHPDVSSGVQRLCSRRWRPWWPSKVL